MIRCQDVYKSYHLGGQRVEALRGVDLELTASGFFGVMGASGSGKSTLLHLLAALDTPDSGSIEIAGRRIDQLGERELTKFRRREIGIVFQQYNLIPTMTARENIELPGMLAREDGAWLSRRSDELLDQLGLTERAAHRPDALSGGEQQRVAIARSLLFAPPVLFADEPTGNLDSQTSEKLWRLIAELALRNEMLILMVTHEPAAAIHCESVYVLRDGRISGHIETEDLDAAGLATRYQQFVG